MQAWRDKPGARKPSRGARGFNHRFLIGGHASIAAPRQEEEPMESELSVDIERPIADVFKYTTESVSEWSIVCVEDELIEEKPGMVGTTFRIVTEEKGRRMEFQGVIIRHEPPTLNEIQMTGDGFDIEATYTFEDLGGKTRVTQKSRVQGKGFFKVMLFLTGWMMKSSTCKAQEAELASLKKHCEAQAG